MTACTQPGCTGTISDGYCDVCGSPVGAAPFVPAPLVRGESSATLGSPTPAGEPDACPQPGCTGRIVDGYCDVCGSPVGAAPFVVAATSAASSGPATAAGLAAVPAPTPDHAPVEEEEIPTQGLPRVNMPEIAADGARPCPGLSNASRGGPAAR
jgi:serine/threonine-protein kinase PknG